MGLTHDLRCFLEAWMTELRGSESHDGDDLNIKVVALIWTRKVGRIGSYNNPQDLEETHFKCARFQKGPSGRDVVKMSNWLRYRQCDYFYHLEIIAI